MNKKKFRLPSTPFNRLFLAWGIFLLVNLAFSESPANSLFSFSFSTSLNSLTSPILPFTTSWIVALSSLGTSFKNAILGAGIGNFSNAFTQFRPADFNQNELWFFRFNQSASPFITTLVEQGALGLFFWAWFFYKTYITYKSYKSYDQEFFFNARTRLFVKGFFLLVVLWLLVFFLPIPFPVFPALSLIVLISLISLAFFFAKKKMPGFHLVPIPFFILPLSLISLIFLIILLNLFALRFSPAAFVQESQKSLAQAETLAAAKAQKSKIKSLIIASVSQAERAVALNPNSSILHQNLAVIFSRLTRQVDNADEKANTAYAKAIELDPANPKIYFDFGRFNYNQNNLAAAEKSFLAATSLKEDYAPAWYALYQLYETLARNAKIAGNTELENKLKKSAKSALKTAEDLVCQDRLSENCEKLIFLLK